MSSFLRVAVVALCVALGSADILLHVPHGSNNRLRTQNADVGNQNRLFDSNNGPEGGYNAPTVGRQMYYFGGSILPIEFSISQGLGSKDLGGAPAASENSVLIQYMCQDNLRDGMQVTTNGENSETIPYDRTTSARRSTDNMYYYFGMHENFQYYDICAKQVRNQGLFVGEFLFPAGATSIYTRQNPSGQRFGFECPEERDYYPYWSATPWRDIAILTDRVDLCDWYKSESQNVKSKTICLSPTTNSVCTNISTIPSWNSLLGVNIPLDCIQGPWLENGIMSNKIDGYLISYNWTVPNLPHPSCAIRVRYNVSSADFPVWMHEANALDFKKNGQNLSPYRSYSLQHADSVTTDENGLVGLYHMPWWTPSFTYQDRSHTFAILAKPETVSNTIYNLNVRGKRGNIVQAFPSTEYDFSPNVLTCKVGQWIHMQWIGSDRNPNNYAGEGTAGTDRNNLIQIADLQKNLPIDPSLANLLPRTSSMRAAFNDLFLKPGACAPYTDLGNLNDNEQNQNAKNCAKLNPQDPYMDVGLVPCQQVGVYYYMSTRNNNFSNRSQKGTIVVVPCPAGDPTCSNADILPVDSNTLLFDSMGQVYSTGPAAGASLRLALAAVVVVASAILFF